MQEKLKKNLRRNQMSSDDLKELKKKRKLKQPKINKKIYFYLKLHIGVAATPNQEPSIKQHQFCDDF